jgi:hypothetical protein
VYGDDKALILTRRMKVFLKQLRKKIGFDIVVTSGVRDLRDQAGAMYTKLKTYGYKSLVDLYPDELVAGMQNAGSADEVYRLLKQRVSSGMTVSRHLAGDAIDFRTRNLTTAQVSALKKAGEEMGAKVLWEEDHLHMQGFGSALPLWAWAGIGLAVAGAVAGGAWAVSRRVGR